MNFIVSEFANLIKGCSNGLAMEKEIWQRGIQLQCQAFAQALEDYDTELARQYAGKQEILRLDRRTMLCLFGTVTFFRRLVRREGEKPFYPLERVLGLASYQRYSPLLLYSVTKVAAGSVYRAAAEAVNTLTPLDISHQTVGRMVRTVGEKYAQYEENMANPSFSSDEPLEKPKYLFIEGDGVVMKGQPKNKVEMHRFQVATGVKQIGKRRILTGLRVIAGFDRKHVLELLDAYLDNHYDLTQCTVLSNSDGGRGYTKDVFDELAAGSRRHEHFRDRYHVNEKIRQRLGWIRKRGMVDRLHREVWKHDWEEVHCCLDMLEGEASNAEEEENVKKLQAYLERNWECLTPLAMREGLEKCLKGLGTCESNHRTYTYRMKKQGRRWSSRGGLAMIKVLTGLKNGDLEQALATDLRGIPMESRKKYRNAVREALKKPVFVPHVGTHQCSIANYGPSSSPMGYLASALNW